MYLGNIRYLAELPFLQYGYLENALNPVILILAVLPD